MQNRIRAITLFALTYLGCNMNRKTEFDLQGHRGCRGLMPENTWAAFATALELGVTTLEMDVVISKDSQVVVSHEPWLSHEFCSGPKGETITDSNEKSFNLYQMNYETIRRCDCGSKPHPRFPEQKKMPAFKPLLNEVIQLGESWATAHKKPPVRYNIETKSELKDDGIFQPPPAQFTKMVMDVIRNSGIEKRTTIQSFDVRTLQEAKKSGYKGPLALLIENKSSIQQNLDSLGFIPEIYSPDYTLVNAEMISFCHSKNIKVIPWTVNSQPAADSLIILGVDGMITDYPDRVK